MVVLVILGLFLFIIKKLWQTAFRHKWKILLFSILIGGSICIFTVVVSLRTIKTFSKNVFFSNTHHIYDRSGELIGYTSPKISIFTPLEVFPTRLRDTILAVEDRTFYSNIGISFSGFFRSVIFYIPSIVTGYRPRGGSTITQQLMRQIYLSNVLSFTRKFREMVLSIVATTKISKNDILEAYMNNAYFCNNIYGFRSAADVLFNKALNDLDPNEIATLVAMLKGPEYSPVQNIKKLIDRRNSILKTMMEDKIISIEEYGLALTKPIEISIDKFNHVNFLSLEIKNYIIKKFGQEAYEKGGLKIFTSIDKEMQKTAEEELKTVCLTLERECLWEGPVGRTNQVNDLSVLNPFLESCGRFFTPVIILNNKGQFIGYKISGQLSEESIKKYETIKTVESGDIVIIEKTQKFLANVPTYNGQVTILKNGGYGCGDILATVGGIDLFKHRDDITKTPREVGSCMKVIDTAIIFETVKYPTNFLIVDGPAVVEQNKLRYVSSEDFASFHDKYHVNGNKDVWPIANWDGKHWGELTFRTAFENSRNIPFVSLILNHVGHKRFKHYLDQLLVTRPGEDFYPAMITGSVGISPRGFAELVCGMINYGAKINSSLIKEVCNEQNEIIEKIETQARPATRVFSKQTMFAVLSCMKGCVARGTGKRLLGVLNNIYSKTGTSSNNQDAMCLCVTKDLVIFVTICKNNGKSLGRNVWGAAYPVMCVKAILEKIRGKLRDEPVMKQPANISIKNGKYNAFGSSFIIVDEEVQEISFDEDNSS